jgi:formate/nitrite transporter FocA (FNT family)
MFVSGLMGLPTGLLLVLLTGSELFTGNTALVPIAVIEGKATMAQLVKNWTVAYAFNFVGSVALAYLAYTAGLPAAGTAKAVAVGKCSLPFVQVRFRSVQTFRYH